MMGLFSGQVRTEPREEALPLDQGAQAFDELPAPPRTRKASTVVSRGITVTGDIRGEGLVQIEGNLEGAIEIKGSVTVSTHGKVQGPITTDVVRVAGFVKGDITARSHLRLERTGSVEGDVTSASLVIEDGGRLDGRSTMMAPRPREEGGFAQFEDGEELRFGPNYHEDEELD